MALGLILLTPALDVPLAVQSSARLLVLGRGREAGLGLPDPSVSARHACLRKRGQAYLLTDEGSQNGTAVWSAAAAVPVYLTPGSPRVLEDGDRLVLGHVELLVCLGDLPEGVELVSDASQLPLRLVGAALSARGLHPTPEELSRALRELETAPDEAIGGAKNETPTPTPVSEHRPEVVRHDARLTDGAILGASVVTLAGGLYALGWLLH